MFPPAICRPRITSGTLANRWTAIRQWGHASLQRSTVNGEKRQESSTDLLLHSIPEIIAELSRGMTLRAGTVIATGTPAGAGMGFTPPKFLQPGDVVVCEIDGIGALTNPVGR